MKRTLQLPLIAGFISLFPALLLAQAPGSLDLAFVPATQYSDVLWALDVQADGKVLVAGRQGPYYGVVYRLDGDGQRDAGFQSGARATCADSAVPQINTLALQTNGNIILGGQFTYFDVPSRLRLAQLDPSGALEATFTPAARDTVAACVVQPDGRILLGGSFTNFQGSGKSYLVRLNPDGSVDNSFNPQGTGPQAKVSAMALGVGGKIVIGGDFTNVNGLTRPRVARLLADGTVDTTFDPGPEGADGAVAAVAIQPDNRVVLGGSFLHLAGNSSGRIGRLMEDGSLDTSFQPGTGCDNFTVWAVAVQANGKILAGGRFTSVNGTPHSKIVRLSPDGSIDATFDPAAGAGTGSSDEIRALKLQPDGKILVAGKFTTFSGQPRYGLARLHGDPIVAPPQLWVQATPTGLVLNWTGTFTLQSAPQVIGPYSDVAGAPNPPCTLPYRFAGEFFRLRNRN